MFSIRALLLIVVISVGGHDADPGVFPSPENARNQALAGNYEFAIELLNAHLKKYPNDPIGIRDLGTMYLLTGRFDEARLELSKSIGLDRSDGVAFNNRAKVFEKLGENDLAMADYERAITLGFDNDDVRNCLGVLCSDKGEKSKAIEHFSAAIRFDPEHAMYYLNRGTTLTTLGKHREAISDFSKAIELTPDDWLPWAYRRDANRQIGEIKKAEQDGEMVDRLKAEDLESRGDFVPRIPEV